MWRKTVISEAPSTRAASSRSRSTLAIRLAPNGRRTAPRRTSGQDNGEGREGDLDPDGLERPAEETAPAQR